MRVRKRKLKWIKGTRSVCLGMDDRKSFKIIRFRCNAEIDFSPSYFAGGHCIDTGCRMGVLAGFNHLHGCDMEDDYAERTAERAIECIKDVFRSVYGDSLAEFNSFCQKVFGMVSDQALQKTCRLLKERYFHNCILIHRDPAHAVRIAMKHPLERNEEIIPVTNALFKGDHALLKDIRFSDVWQEKLKDCQRRVLQHDNVLGGDLQELISTFNFLEPRFESFSRPLFTVICLLVPIVMMLTMIAEDVRDRDTKKQAEKVLRQMSFKFIINMGLSADYAETALRLVREFDVLAKDPATSRVLLEACRQKLHLLFQEGRIVKIPKAGKTAINLAMEQLQILDKLIACGDRTFNLYSESPTTVLAEGVRAFNEILDVAWDRLDADFRHNDLYMTFDVFHLSHWDSIVESQLSEPNPPRLEDDTSPTATRMRMHWRRIWHAVGTGQEKNIDDWFLAVLIAIRHRNKITAILPQRNPGDVDPTLGPLDNRIPWYAALEDIDRGLPCFSTLCRYYLSVLDGTPTVERDLGVVQDCYSQHQGGSGEAKDETCSLLIECRLDGPRTQDEVVRRSAKGLHLTEWSKQLATDWIRYDGIAKKGSK